MSANDNNHTGGVDSSSSSSSLQLALLWDALFPFVWRAGSVAVGLVAILGGILYAKQESLLYFPVVAGLPRRNADNPRGYRSPREHGIRYDSHRIRTADGVHIHGWFLYCGNNKGVGGVGDGQQPKKLPTILFFHGNAGNIGVRLPNAAQMISNLRANVFLVDYRGYGDSDHESNASRPTEAGLKLDAEAALRFLQTQLPRTNDSVDPSKIYIFGRSLGGAVALHAAAAAEKQQERQQEPTAVPAHAPPPVAGVILENTFLSISDMVDALMPWLTPIKPFVLRMKWDCLSIVRNQLSQTPVLFLAGDQDELVPHSHMLRLYRAAAASKHPATTMHVIPGGKHNESWLQGGWAYWEAIRNFLAQTSTTTPISGATTAAAGASSSVSSAGGGSIPLMPQQFLGMVKEAATTTTTSSTTASSAAGEIQMEGSTTDKKKKDI